MARIRSRGHAAVLRAAPLRSGLGEVEPKQNHRQRCRLAFPQRAEARAEGVRFEISAEAVKREKRGDYRMPILQTRRRFLSTLSLAGAAGLIRPPAVFAAEGRLETTSVRLAKMPDMCMAPQLVGQELLRDEGFTDIQYVDTTNDQLAKALTAD